MKSKSPEYTIEVFSTENKTVVNHERKLFHIFEEEDTNALWAAFAAKRPLLLRGDPGTGKSQTAKAIAERLGWAFVKETITGSTELSDLHWHFDAIARLGEAQILGVEHLEGRSPEERKQSRKKLLSPLKFLSPGGFWWAYNWRSAYQQYQRCTTRLRSLPYSPEEIESEAPKGVVLLLDEIDKAQPDLANGLLETLADRSFNVPYLSSEDDKAIDKGAVKNPVEAQDSSNVLVVVTTNEERELPTAFLRRCYVHTLQMEPSKKVGEKALTGNELAAARLQWLIDRGRLHFGSSITESVYRSAAEMVWEDREGDSPYKPGLAEYIDLLTTLSTVNIADNQQQELLEKVSRFALKAELSE